MPTQKGLLFDVTACELCGACWLADKERNKFPVPAGDFTDDQLSDRAFLAMARVEGRGVRHSCMHCLNPSCASVCPVGALEKTDIGAVVYHGSRCIGCRYCIVACPFGVPKYEWSQQLPYVRKCDLCHDRISAGREPACSSACPTGALVFGDRTALLVLARDRIRRNPGRYLDHIYGEREVGGTSLLIISDVELEKLGYPSGLVNDPMPNLTWAALRGIPKIVVFGSACLVGLAWLTKRRAEVLAAEGRSTPDEHGGR